MNFLISISLQLSVLALFWIGTNYVNASNETDIVSNETDIVSNEDAVNGAEIYAVRYDTRGGAIGELLYYIKYDSTDHHLISGFENGRPNAKLLSDEQQNYLIQLLTDGDYFNVSLNNSTVCCGPTNTLKVTVSDMTKSIIWTEGASMPPIVENIVETLKAYDKS